MIKFKQYLCVTVKALLEPFYKVVFLNFQQALYGINLTATEDWQVTGETAKVGLGIAYLI